MKTTLPSSTARFYAKLASLLLIALLPCFAQNPRGTLRGMVQDTRGGRIPQAKVTVQVKGTGVESNAASDARGEFRIDGLLPGSYHIVVSSTGFADATADVSVAVSTVRDVTVTMQPAVVQESVKVEARQSSVTTQPIDLASAVHQTVISEHDLATLPLAARSFANIAYLAPGTEPVEPSDPTKARITAVSTGGSSGLNNELSVDGGDNSDDFIGGFLQNFSVDAIQEFAFRPHSPMRTPAEPPQGRSSSQPDAEATIGMVAERSMKGRQI